MKHVPRQNAAEAVEAVAAVTEAVAVAMAVGAVDVAVMAAVADAAEIAATGAIAGSTFPNCECVVSELLTRPGLVLSGIPPQYFCVNPFRFPVNIGIPFRLSHSVGTFV
jgi:hypothetical protein